MALVETMIGLKVFVYYHFRKKMYSVKALEGPQRGKVILHTHDLFLEDCRFKVSESGRQRVLRERVKNVHAGVVGRIAEPLAEEHKRFKITYDPYKYSAFMLCDTNAHVHEARFVQMNNRGVYIVA
jgi:hypothetical protein